MVFGSAFNSDSSQPRAMLDMVTSAIPVGVGGMGPEESSRKASRLSFLSTHTHARTHASTRTHARTHARTQARKRTHTHARTHARTQAYFTGLVLLTLFLQDMLSLALPCILIIFSKAISFSKFPMHC